MIRLTQLVITVSLLLIALASTATTQGQTRTAALAYVRDDTVTLADERGQPLAQSGPTFTYGQGARLFWSADGDILYIARSDGLYATGSTGSPAVKMPGSYGRTLAISQDGETLYYLDTATPVALDEPLDGLLAYPLREGELLLLDGGAGRLTGYFGRFVEGAGQANIAFSAALYAREGGLLGVGRPELWPTYGANVFGTCCFPQSGLGIYDVQLGEFSIYDEEFVPGAAALSLTQTHLAGPTTTEGVIRVYDLITGGSRDYLIDIAGGLGTIERIAWSPDDTYLYFIARRPASNPLTLDQQPGMFTVDPSSADIVLYRLSLVTGVIRELAWRADMYGVSSLAATDQYVFAVVVEPNYLLVQDLNARRVRPGSTPDDPALAKYQPQTHLWRVSLTDDEVIDIASGVWGVTARPLRGSH